MVELTIYSIDSKTGKENGTITTPCEFAGNIVLVDSGYIPNADMLNACKIDGTDYVVINKTQENGVYIIEVA